MSKLKESTKELKEEYDRTSIRLEMKKRADKIIVIVLFAFVGVVIGSWLGLGFVSLLRSIEQGIKSFLTF